MKAGPNFLLLYNIFFFERYKNNLCKQFLIIVILMFVLKIHSQNYLAVKATNQTYNFNNSILNEDVNQTLDPDLLDLTDTNILLSHIMNNEFSRLITGNSFSGLGNYASASTVDKTLSASINVLKPYGIWDISISGGSNDDITTFISNTELNSGIGLGIGFHYLLKNDINIYDEDIGIIEDNELLIIEKYRKEIAEIENFNSKFKKQIDAKKKEIKELIKLIENNSYNENKEKSLNQKLKEEEASLDLITKQIDYYKISSNLKIELTKLEEKYNKPEYDTPFKIQNFKNDSISLFGQVINLKQQLLKNNKNKKTILLGLKNNQVDEEKENYYIEQMVLLNTDLESLESKYEYYKNNPNRLWAQKNNLKDKEIRANREKINEIKAEDVNFTWLTFGAEASYNEYSLFDESLEFDKQIFNENDLISEFTLSFSKYSNISTRKYQVRNVKFYNFGVKAKIDNNINELELYEVRTSTVIADDRELLKKQNAYKGTFANNNISATLFSDYYKFFGNKDNVGIHLQGKHHIGSFKPVTSARVGFIIPFSKTDDLKSYLNLELFLGLNDIFKNAKDKSIFSRNIIGLQATLPFNFKTL